MTFAILCPGQSAQTSRMADLLAAEPEAIRIFEAFERVTGKRIEKVLADEQQLSVNAIAQPLICAIEIASYRCLTDRLPETGFFAGYSVGELAAYGCSGIIDVEDTIRLARIRAEAMDQASPGPSAMIAVRGLKEADLLASCSGKQAYISIRNGDDRFVVSGTAEVVESLESAVRSLAHVTRLRVNVASHTPLMAAAVEPFRRALAATPFQITSGRVLAGIDGAVVRGRDEAIAKLTRQLTETIDWQSCVEALSERGCRSSLELLPGEDLTKMVAELGTWRAARAMSQFRSLEGVAAWAARIER